MLCIYSTAENIVSILKTFIFNAIILHTISDNAKTISSINPLDRFIEDNKWRIYEGGGKWRRHEPPMPFLQNNTQWRIK